MRITINTATDLITNYLQNLSVPKDQSEIICKTIIDSHIRGKGTHGISRLPIYKKKIQNKLMEANTKVSIINETSCITVMDANHGFGQVAAYEGMNMCINKAKKTGIAIATVRQSNSFGAACYYSEMAAGEQMIGVVLGNSSPAIAVPGGKKALIGTNPISVAFPTNINDYYISLDMATSVAARSKIRKAAKNSENIPEGWALDEFGFPTTSALEALKGSLLPIGGYKGFGLALVVDILAGLLSGAAFAGDVLPLATTSGYSNYGHFLLAINYQHFLTEFEYEEKIQYLLQKIKQNTLSEIISIPGQKSYQNKQDNSGFIEISDELYKDIN